jgi:hypothetical protein
MPTVIDGDTGVSQVQNGVIVQADLASGVAGTGPAFSASLSSTQSLTTGVFAKIAATSEGWDTASCYNNTGSTVGGIPAYAFLPNIAGYYTFKFVIGRLLATTSLQRIIGTVYKNGTTVGRQIDLPATMGNGGTWLSGVVDVYLNGTTDYVELYVYSEGTGTITVGSTDANTTYFQGVLARAA